MNLARPSHIGNIITRNEQMHLQLYFKFLLVFGRLIRARLLVLLHLNQGTQVANLSSYKHEISNSVLVFIKCCSSSLARKVLPTIPLRSSYLISIPTSYKP